MSDFSNQHLELIRRSTFGFLDVVELPGLGFCGGLLIVSHLGRPLEFHCTAPMAENRTQQIMYGQTYRGFLLTEQVGAALIDKAKGDPSAYLITDPDMLPISQIVDAPVALLATEHRSSDFDGTGLVSLEIEHHRLWCTNVNRDSTGANSAAMLQTLLGAFQRRLPLDEPFERINAAIQEAHAVLRAG